MKYRGMNKYGGSSIRILEYDNSYILTTFKIGTRILSSLNTHNNFKIDTNEPIDEIKKLLSKDKPLFIVIKNPIDRFITAAVQVTFQGATQDTAAFSLAKWGDESYFYKNFWKEFCKDTESPPNPIYDYEFDTNNLKPFYSISKQWEIWLDMVHFNLMYNNQHLNRYHHDCYYNIYKELKNSHTIKIITDIELKNSDVFNKITGQNFNITHSNSNHNWNSYIKQNIIVDIDSDEPSIGFNPNIFNTRILDIIKYIESEYLYYNKFRSEI